MPPCPLKAPWHALRELRRCTQVLVRVRPLNERERGLNGEATSLTQRGSSGIDVATSHRTQTYRFDEVCGPESTQEELFQRARPCFDGGWLTYGWGIACMADEPLTLLLHAVCGQPVVNNVMQGYNACCLAYGQTGAGKTFTMQGELADAGGEARGLTPRVFQAIFRAIEEREGEAQGALRQYTCKCSFLQIYNEQVSDLLCPGGQTLTLRYDAKAGVYAENLTERVVVNGAHQPASEVRRCGGAVVSCDMCTAFSALLCGVCK